MRCSAVAKAAAAAGEEVCFLVSPDSGTELLTKQGFAVHRMKKGGALGWDPDEAVSAIAALRPSAVLADTYRVDDTALKKLADAAELVYLDDLYAFDYPVRTIINYNLEASVERYRPTAYPGRRLYLGASWFPVREQIAQAAEHGKNAGARLRPAVQTVLITTGATDQAGMMRQMLRLSEDFRSVPFSGTDRGLLYRGLPDGDRTVRGSAAECIGTVLDGRYGCALRILRSCHCPGIDDRLRSVYGRHPLHQLLFCR
jgi:spore coat polysaccharide biosynthesis predicted glycosyltransferase SpsG